MYIYIGLVIFQLFWVLILKYRNLRGEFFDSVIPFFTMFLLAAFRSENVGNDSKNYLTLFEQIQHGANINIWNDRFEKGYLLFNKYLGSFFTNQYVIFIFSALVIYGISWWVIRNTSCSKWLSVFLFLTIGLYSNSINVIRLAMAYSFCLLAYYMLIERRMIRCLLLVILAFFFHSSAAAFVFVVIIDRIHINKKSVFYWGVATGILFVLFNTILERVLDYRGSYSSYVEKGTYFGSGYLAISMNIILWVIIVGMIYILYRNGKLKEPEYTEKRLFKVKTLYWEKVCIFSMVMISAYICGFKLNLMDRVAGYFRCVMIILLPNTLEEIMNEKDKQLFELFLVIIMLVFFLFH